MTKLAIQDYFPTPVGEIHLAEAAELNAALKARFLEWELNEPPRTTVPTAVVKEAVYESDFSLFRRQDPAVQRLAHFCLTHVGEMVMRMNRYSAAEMHELRIYDHSWYHVTRHGGYTGPHNHPMASWSGVYCVCPGEPDTAHPESGVLRLFDNRAEANMYLDAGNAHLADRYAFGNMGWHLQAGQLIIFPSYLFHEVAPFRGRDERITVAFNCWVREQGQAVNEPLVKQRRQGERNGT